MLNLTKLCDLLCYLKDHPYVEHLQVDSAICRLLDTRPILPPCEQLILARGQKFIGKAFFITNKRRRDMWEIEHGKACMYAKLRGFKVCLHSISNHV